MGEIYIRKVLSAISVSRVLTIVSALIVNSSQVTDFCENYVSAFLKI